MKTNYKKFSELFKDHIKEYKKYEKPDPSRIDEMYTDESLLKYYKEKNFPIGLKTMDINKTMENTYTLHYELDGKTITYKPVSMWNIINEYSGIFYMYFGNLKEDQHNHYFNMRSFCNEGMYILSYLQIYGNTSKSKKFLLENTPNKLMVEDITRHLKKIKFGFKRSVEVINNVIGSFLFFKVNQETDPNKTNVYITDHGKTISTIMK